MHVCRCTFAFINVINSHKSVARKQCNERGKEGEIKGETRYACADVCTCTLAEEESKKEGKPLGKRLMRKSNRAHAFAKAKKRFSVTAREDNLIRDESKGKK